MHFSKSVKARKRSSSKTCNKSLLQKEVRALQCLSVYSHNSIKPTDAMIFIGLFIYICQLKKVDINIAGIQLRKQLKEVKIYGEIEFQYRAFQLLPFFLPSQFLPMPLAQQFQNQSMVLNTDLHVIINWIAFKILTQASSSLDQVKSSP